MSAPLNDGGGAFPTPYGVQHNDGMTMRDFFAKGAMQNFADQIGSQSDQEWFDRIAAGSYRMADAMIKARESK